MARNKGHQSDAFKSLVDIEEDGRVRCKLCIEFNALDYGGAWIQKKSFSSHQKSRLHKASLERQQEAEIATVQLNAMHRQEEETFAAPRIDFQLVPPSLRAPQKDVDCAAEQIMWDEFVMNEVPFEAGDGPGEALQQETRTLERQVQEFGMWNGVERQPDDVDINDTELLWDEEEHDEMLSEVMRNIALQHEVVNDQSEANSTEWFPYKSKLMFLLDTIDNLPRLRISNSLMRVILWLLQEAGVKNVPAFGALRQVQKKNQAKIAVPTVSWMSSKGNTFSFNDPCALIANDYANPVVCPHIQRYPVIPHNGVISEVWHAQKWRKDLDRHILSPMYDDGQKRHYYIDEPARMKDGRFVIPVRWLESTDGKVFAEVWSIERDAENATSTIRDEKITLVAAQDLQENMLDLEDAASIPVWSSITIAAGHPARMPNPDRALAGGDPLYTSFIDIFGDDVSGNRSKSWNKHWNTYISHRNLPRKLLHQEFHIHFVSTSTHASIPEQFQGIKNKIESTHLNPLKVQHATTRQQIRLKVYCNCGPGDNPAQSELSGHIGGNGNFPCRKCHVGGTQKAKESEEGFHRLFYVGEPRSAAETLATVEKQVQAACLGVAQTVKDLQSETGVKDTFTQDWIERLIERARKARELQPRRPVAEIQAELMAWVNDHKSAVYNGFLTMEGFDAARDTPVEILHTVLLGIEKYLWHGSHTPWTSAQKKLYSARLQSTNTNGLSVHAIRAKYILQYANSLIGRQFKTLVQVNVFHVYDLVNSLQFSLTKAVGELGALLWFPEIRNLEEYISDVEVAVANVLDIAALIDPSKIVAKIKYHLLSHIREDIIRFGPIVGVATEVFECFNAIFRFCSILSNHLAPSRDIAYQLAAQELMKHILSGGWWVSKGGDWKRAGSGVRGYMTTSPVLQTLFGWTTVNVDVVGHVQLEPLKHDMNKKLLPRAKLSWAQTLASKAMNIVNQSSTDQWYQCKNVVAASQDKCVVGSWIFARSPVAVTNTPIIGRIIEVIQNCTETLAYAAIDVFQISSTRDEKFGMPALTRRFHETEIFVIPTTDILFECNAQHDCYQAKCCASGERYAMQERIESLVVENYIVHQPLERFLVNTHALHNAHLLRAILPRELIAPIPFVLDREAHHIAIAMGLRVTQDKKRAAAAAKAAEKKRAAPTTSVTLTRKRRRMTEDGTMDDDREDDGVGQGESSRSYPNNDHVQGGRLELGSVGLC